MIPQTFTSAFVHSPADTHANGDLAHCTDSYLGVIYLYQGSPTYGSFLATIGKPSAPRASK